MSEKAIGAVQKCSFCGASSDDVERLFVAQGVAICDGCARAIGAAGAVDLPRSKSPVDGLVGRWIKRTDGAAPVSVSLRFTGNGLLFSTVQDGATANEKLLRYSLDGASLSTVEMVAFGEQTTDKIEIESRDTMSIHTKNGISVFDRDKSDI